MKSHLDLSPITLTTILDLSSINLTTKINIVLTTNLANIFHHLHMHILSVI